MNTEHRIFHQRSYKTIFAKLGDPEQTLFGILYVTVGLGEKMT